MKLKFIYWFAFYNINSPTVRYRGQYPLEFIKKHYGIHSFFVVPGYQLQHIRNFLKAYISALLFPKKDSIIVLQSINSNFIYAKALKFLVKIRKNKTIYDIDDADYLRYPAETIFHFIKNCSMVTLGSSELVKNISKLNSNSILITCPVPDLNIVKIKRNELFTIGWVGDLSTGHKESLMTSFFPSLIDLPFKVKLILLGVSKKTDVEFLKTYFKEFENVFLEIPENINWTNETEIQQRIVMFDIGIATLLDNEFFRSKSAFKTKQCFNNGIPVLSNDIAENNKFVEHGVNGFLCNNPAEFRRRIIEVKEMSDDDYFLLSRAARNSIHKFNLTKYSHDLIDAYKRISSHKDNDLR